MHQANLKCLVAQDLPFDKHRTYLAFQCDHAESSELEIFMESGPALTLKEGEIFQFYIAPQNAITVVGNGIMIISGR